MTTYSTSLKLSLIADGDQAGTWGQTTNNNLGTLLEQAITGVVAITMIDANYTLSNLNGVSDEARNAVLVVGGTNTAQRDLIAPAVEKLYVVKNSTGQNLRIKTAAGAAITIPNGVVMGVYCDGTDFYTSLNGTPGSLSVGTSLTVGTTAVLGGALTGTTATFSGAISSVSPSFTGTPTAPTATVGTNTTQVATTAFVQGALGNLGTMATQNANNVNITGGSITGITDLAVADGGTGASSITSNSVILGNGSSALNGNLVAPGSSGNVLTSNGTTWVSSTSFTWNVQSASTAISNGTSYSIPSNTILVLGTAYFSTSGNAGGRMSVQIKNSGGAVLQDFIVCGGNENNGTDGGSGMSTRSAWSIAIPSTAAGGTLYFYNSSGSNSFSGTINQIVKSV